MDALQLEALAQIKQCMSAPSEPVACVMLRADGSAQEIVTDHRKIRDLLGGQPTVVGAIASLGVQAVMREGAKKKSKHSFPEAFEPTIKGDVLLFRIDDDASPLPYTPSEYKEWLDAGCPDEVEEEEEEEGEEIEGEEDEEEEGEEMEGEEEDDEEDEDEEEEEGEEDFETFAAKLKTLPLQELKLACQSLQVSSSGTKDQLIARLHEAAQAAEDDDDDDDDDDNDDDDDDDEAEVAQPPAPAASAEKAKGKAKVSPGPVKTIAKGRKATSRA